ncbi:MAG: NADP-dependent isocitrate dehydrogenase [Pseudomonadota bacterium]
MNLHAPDSFKTATETAEPSHPLTASNTAVPIAVAYGDGIGPEIMAASLKVLEAAGARLDPQIIEIGEQVYTRGVTAGIEKDAWQALRSTGVFYKAPITTPQGGGYKSLNVTVRKSLGLYANVRPCAALAPYVATKHPRMDVVIVRENEEDLYAGVEHRQTDEVYQCLKLVSRPGTERIIRYAFEYARANARKKVSCFSKDNIMKLTDGLFHKVFDEIKVEYPEIETDHWIIDIGTARLAAKPETFDVIVTGNLYGDIISDVAAEISGSVGLGASANIGPSCAMFEAIHGSAPDIAGEDIANPSGLLLAGVQMLVHVGQPDIATALHNAWAKTIEEGVHTADIFQPDSGAHKVGTNGFADAVIARLGEEPSSLPVARYQAAPRLAAGPVPDRSRTHEKVLVGTDLFVHWRGTNPDELAVVLKQVKDAGLPQLDMISNRGVKVWPNGLPETMVTDHWRCRFLFDGAADAKAIPALMLALAGAGIEVVKTENLYTFDGERGYSLGQGQ